MKSLRKRSRWLVALAVVLAMLGIGGWQCWAWWKWVISPPQPAFFEGDADEEKMPTTINIEPGTPGQYIGADLKEKGLIRSPVAWKMWSRWQALWDSNGGFQAGSYEIFPKEDMTAIASKIWQGDVIKVGFTIPEGWTIKQMAAYFESQDFFTAKDFLEATKKIPREKYPWLPANLPHLEGFLYPDTYQAIADNITPEAIVNQMLLQFQKLALPLYQEVKDETDMTILEWVTLASIVEEESVVDSERGLIAGVFTRRLQEDITLGADPTVEYGLGITQTPENPLTWDQVSTPNPYNTYINLGLPPTPISAPGVKSLAATLSPEITEYLYFVARYDGTHIFSSTLAEHEAAVERVRNEIDNR
ncbi:MAG: endolytic transglycosylase MltG [Oscillatoria sp. SIO1A7]|nr:endolytic transglycosylase MltG [Oscillatoria sp. SIO1A7]